VYEDDKVAGTISVSDLSQIAPDDWDKVTVGEFADRSAIRVTNDCDLSEALRLLVRERGAQMLLVTDNVGALQGIVTKTDILRAVKMSSG
jgi:predicted transcriptional regulator